MNYEDAFDFKSMQRIMSRIFHQTTPVYERESTNKRSFSHLSDEEPFKKQAKVKFSDSVTTITPCFIEDDEYQHNESIDDFIKTEYPFAQKKHLKGDYLYTFCEMRLSYDRVMDFCIDRNAEIFNEQASFGKLEFISKFKLHSCSPSVDIVFCILLHPTTDHVLCASTYIAGDYLQYRKVLQDLTKYITHLSDSDKL